MTPVFCPVLRKLGLVFAALALFSIAGGHWAVLQSVAWAEMLHDYTQRTGSIAVAVEQTFDGQHPCELCQQIQVAKAKEHKEAPAAPAKKLRDYTQKTGSVAVAVEQTFDGAHPCELCWQIASAKQQEAKAQSDKQKPSPDQKSAKAEKPAKALPPDETFSSAWTAATSLRREALNPLSGPSRTEQPPTPPPRSGTIAA